MRLIAIVFAFVLIASARSPAFANPDGDALEASGLIGTWAADCAGKSRFSFLKFQGAPRERRTLQDGTDTLTPIRNVTRDGNRISYGFELSGIKYSVVAETVNNKFRILEFSANSDKVSKIVNGISERTKAPLPWYGKCPDTHEPVEYIEVGQMVMIQEGQNYAVLNGWNRKHGDYSVKPGECNVQVKDVSPSGVFQLNGKMLFAMDGSGTMADADNCRWEFLKDITFTDGQVLVHAKQGANVEFNRDRVVTTGITFSEKK